MSNATAASTIAGAVCVFSACRVDGPRVTVFDRLMISEQRRPRRRASARQDPRGSVSAIHDRTKDTLHARPKVAEPEHFRASRTLQPAGPRRVTADHIVRQTAAHQRSSSGSRDARLHPVVDGVQETERRIAADERVRVSSI